MVEYEQEDRGRRKSGVYGRGFYGIKREYTPSLNQYVQTDLWCSPAARTLLKGFLPYGKIAPFEGEVDQKQCLLCERARPRVP